MTKYLKTLFIGMACLIGSQVAFAQYHIIVNINDPSNVTFTATEEFALVNDSSSYSSDGIMLRDFFSADAGSFGSTPQNFRANGMLEAEKYNVLTTFSYLANGWDKADLNIYSNSSATTQNFSTSAPAFYGAMSADFSTSPLRPVGSTGDIYAGLGYDIDVDTGPIVGQFIIVRNYPNPHLADFSYDSGAGIVIVTIKASALTAYKLVEADDLDFTSPDQDPIPLTSASLGSLDGDVVTTTAGGEATVQFDLGTSKPATFFRAVRVTP